MMPSGAELDNKLVRLIRARPLKVLGIDIEIYAGTYGGTTGLYTVTVPEKNATYVMRTNDLIAYLGKSGFIASEDCSGLVSTCKNICDDQMDLFTRLPRITSIAEFKKMSDIDKQGQNLSFFMNRRFACDTPFFERQRSNYSVTSNLTMVPKRPVAGKRKMQASLLTYSQPVPNNPKVQPSKPIGFTFIEKEGTNKVRFLQEQKDFTFQEIRMHSATLTLKAASQLNFISNEHSSIQYATTTFDFFEEGDSCFAIVPLCSGNVRYKIQSDVSWESVKKASSDGMPLFARKGNAWVFFHSITIKTPPQFPLNGILEPSNILCKVNLVKASAETMANATAMQMVDTLLRDAIASKELLLPIKSVLLRAQNTVRITFEHETGDQTCFPAVDIDKRIAYAHPQIKDMEVTDFSGMRLMHTWVSHMMSKTNFSTLSLALAQAAVMPMLQEDHTHDRLAVRLLAHTLDATFVDDVTHVEWITLPSDIEVADSSKFDINEPFGRGFGYGLPARGCSLVMERNGRFGTLFLKGPLRQYEVLKFTSTESHEEESKIDDTELSKIDVIAGLLKASVANKFFPYVPLDHGYWSSVVDVNAIQILLAPLFNPSKTSYLLRRIGRPHIGPSAEVFWWVCEGDFRFTTPNVAETRDAISKHEKKKLMKIDPHSSKDTYLCQEAVSWSNPVAASRSDSLMSDVSQEALLYLLVPPPQPDVAEVDNLNLIPSLRTGVVPVFHSIECAARHGLWAIANSNFFAEGSPLLLLSFVIPREAQTLKNVGGGGRFQIDARELHNKRSMLGVRVSAYEHRR